MGIKRTFINYSDTSFLKYNNALEICNMLIPRHLHNKKDADRSEYNIQ